MSIADEKFVSVATFRKSGAAVATPTWIVPLDDGRVGFWTSSSAGKTKRLRTNPVVTVQACNQRGKIKDGSQKIDGTAVLVSSGPEFDAIQAKVKSQVRRDGAHLEVLQYPWPHRQGQICVRRPWSRHHPRLIARRPHPGVHQGQGRSWIYGALSASLE